MVVFTSAIYDIGNVLVRQFFKKGRKVTALILPAEDLNPLNRFKVEIDEGYVYSLSTLIQAFKASKMICHLTGIIPILLNRYRLLEQVNAINNQSVVETFIKLRVQRLVYTSSIHASERSHE